MILGTDLLHHRSPFIYCLPVLVIEEMPKWPAFLGQNQATNRHKDQETAFLMVPLRMIGFNEGPRTMQHAVHQDCSDWSPGAIS